MKKAMHSPLEIVLEKIVGCCRLFLNVVIVFQPNRLSSLLAGKQKCIHTYKKYTKVTHD